jgi:hypothetical protein
MLVTVDHILKEPRVKYLNSPQIYTSVLLLLENNSRQDSEQKPIWQRKKSLITSASVMILLAVVAFASISYFWPHQAMGDLVSFTCRPSSDNETIIIYARVNLTDGMDQEEAMEVANKVFLEAFNQPTERWVLQSFYVNSVHDEKGEWTVSFACVYTSPFAHHGGEGAAVLRRSFTVAINPVNQTATYDG